MKDILRRHIDRLDAVLLRFRSDPEAAAGELDEEKTALDADSLACDEIIAAALYNALATIRTSPEQEKLDGQLIEAIADARSELAAILEYVEKL